MKDNYSKFLNDSSAVLDNFFKDDFSESIAGPNETQNLIGLKKVLSLGGFKLAKFASSAPVLAKKVNLENSKIDTVEEINLNVDTSMHV